jgi:hypothetical protein
VHPLLLIAFAQAVHAAPVTLVAAPHKAIGIPLAFGALVVFFGVILGVMMLVGHVRHRRRQQR